MAVVGVSDEPVGKFNGGGCHEFHTYGFSRALFGYKAVEIFLFLQIFYHLSVTNCTVGLFQVFTGGDLFDISWTEDG